MKAFLREYWPTIAIIAVFEMVRSVFGPVASMASGLVVLTGLLIFLAHEGDKKRPRP